MNPSESSQNIVSAPPTVRMVKELPGGSENEEHTSGTKITYQQRVKIFEEEVKGPKLDYEKIRELSSGGIPDWPGLRSIYWKILLNYLPLNRTEWDSELRKKRDLYKGYIFGYSIDNRIGFVEELTIDPRKNESVDDHPLSTKTTSKWNEFFKDKELMDEIDKDVKRTLPHLHFFNSDKTIGDTSHYEGLKRILFVFAKLNPGIRYVQGMNEILGPIYYIFSSDPNEEWKKNAEADTFFCFTNLMAEIRDNFIKTLDKSSIGVTGQLQRLTNLLHKKDPELQSNFEEKNLNTQFYGFRWLTLMLSQEFDLPDVLRLWDSLFADNLRFELLHYVCVAMLVLLRERLLDGSFADNLKMLQNYPVQDVHAILQKAEEIRTESYEAPPPRPKPVVQQPQQQHNHPQRNEPPKRSILDSLLPKPAPKHTEIAKPTSLPASKEIDHNPSFSEEDIFPVQPLPMPIPPKPFDQSDSDDETTISSDHPLK